MNGFPVNPERRTLCQSFMHLESWTWQNMEQSDRTGLQVGEESITDFALLFLRTNNPRTVFIRKFTRRQERKTGADWEWWFTDGRRWFAMRVQAKRLNSRTQTYDNLIRGSQANHARQVNDLIRSANGQNPQFYPAYCFYNWLPNVSEGTQACQCHDGAPLLGFTIADAYCIKRLILNGRSSYRDVAQVARPIHCLTCCTLHPDRNSLALGAYNKVRDLRGLTELPRLRPAPIPEPTAEVPGYVLQTFEAEYQAEAVEAPKPGLAGVVVIRIPSE